jgi:AraC-like DNA-binding protein
LPDTILTLQFVLHHSLSYWLDDGRKRIMTEGQYNIIASPNLQKVNWFDKGNSHTSTFDIHFSPAYLQKVSCDFPDLADLLEKREKGATSQLGSSAATTSPMMMRIIKAILDCPYTGDLRRNYIQTKVSLLLMLALEQISSHPAEKDTTIHLKRYDLEKIHEAREYLMLNMENPPTLKQLAHKMGLNDFKLKKGYKQVFGMTIFGDFNRERMDKAVECLLEKNMSIADTALLTGYQDPPNFIRAFKAYFGSTPGELRKRHEQLTGKPPTSFLGRPPIHRPGNSSRTSNGKRQV